MQNGKEFMADDVEQIADKRDRVKRAGERIREHAKKCARSCYQMGKELVAIRPVVDELYPKKWIKWSRKHTQGLSRSTVWRWMEVAQNYPEADIADETKLIDLYRQLGLAKKKVAAEPHKPDTTQVPPTVTAPPLEAPPGDVPGEDEKGTSDEISGHGDKDDPPVTNVQEVEDEIEDDDEQEDDDEDEEQEEIETEDEQGAILGEALDLVHQMERLLRDSTLLHSHVEPLKGLLIRLAADAELLAV